MTILSLLIFNAYGDITGDTYTNDSIGNSVSYGDILLCTDSNCTLASAGTDAGDGDVVIGLYDADYTQAECTSVGFFFCTIDKICMNQSTTTGSCGA